MIKEETQANLFAELRELQSIEDVFTKVEQSQMIIAPIYYPSADLQKKIADLQQTSAHLFANVTDAQIKVVLSEDLKLWHKSLVERDEAFTPFDLRTLCSTIQPQFDYQVYADLAGFYRKLPPTASVLSKFDYVITQFFSRKLDNNRRVLRVESKKLVDELQLLNLKWIGKEIDTNPIKSQIRESLITLSRLSAQAKSHDSLKSWIGNEFFDRSREIKRGLTETFFVPEITAAVVICNLITGNSFAALCEADNKIPTYPSKDFRNPKQTQNTVPVNPSFQTLSHTGLEEDFAETMEQERLSNLYSLIGSDNGEDEVSVAKPLQTNEAVAQNNEVIIDKTPSDNQIIENNQLQTNLPNPENHVPFVNSEVTDSDLSKDLNNANLASEITDLGTVNNIDEISRQPQAAESFKKTNPKISDILGELASPNPDRELIRNYLKKSVIAQFRELRFDEFLDANQNLEEKGLTKTLGLIVRAEESMRAAANAESDLSSKYSDEINLLLEEIQTNTNHLRHLMSDTVSARGDNKSPQQSFETLLYATNILVEAQIRLSSAITNLQNKKEKRHLKSQTKEQNSNNYNEITVEESDYKNIPDTQITTVTASQNRFKSINLPNKWLMIAAVAVILLGVSWLFFYSSSPATNTTSTNVQSLDPKLMIGGTGLIKARVGGNTLFGFVNGDWSTETQQKKKDNLKLLLEEGSKYNYNKVLLINQNGDLVGNATESELSVH